MFGVEGGGSWVGVGERVLYTRRFLMYAGTGLSLIRLYKCWLTR